MFCISAEYTECLVSQSVNYETWFQNLVYLLGILWCIRCMLWCIGICCGLYGVCCGVYGICCGVYGVCCGVYGICCGVYGICCGVYGICCGVYGIFSVACNTYKFPKEEKLPPFVLWRTIFCGEEALGAVGVNYPSGQSYVRGV